MKEIEVGANYRVNYIKHTTVTVLETGVERPAIAGESAAALPSGRKDGVRVRFHDEIDGGDALPWVKHPTGSEGLISQRCFIEKAVTSS